MKPILKHFIWFAGGVMSVYFCILLFGVIVSKWTFLFPESLFWARFVAFLPVVIPCVIGILVWRRSKAFAVGIACWIVFFIIYWIQSG